MTTGTMPPVGLHYNGVAIRNQLQLVSLTDMWSAAGGDHSKRPVEWLRGEQAKRFISFMAEDLGMGEVGKSHFGLVRVFRGGADGGGTFAHWQIAMAYAKYLSPEFHMWCNTIVRQHMERRPAASTITVTDIAAEVRSVIGGIVKSVVHNEIAAILPAMIRAELANGLMIRRGKTAGQIWREAGLPRIRNIAGWFGNRLERMGCVVNAGERAEMGDVSARLFDPDKARVWLENGGLAIVKEKIDERMGQGRLRLVQPS
jgi:KilA-N domain